jgi:hypothetical protein
MKMILSYVYWPLLAAVLLVLIWRRPALRLSPEVKLLIILCLAFFVHQMLTGVFDWEHNPRRALPVLFVFAFALTYSVSEVLRFKAGPWIVGAFLLVSSLLTFSDTLFKSPSVSALQIGQIVRAQPMAAFELLPTRLDRRVLPTLPVDDRLRLFDYPKAKISGKYAGIFFLIQVFLFICSAFLVFVLSRAKLIPSWSVIVFLVFYVVSITMRF